MDNILIAVIVPAYNCETYIAECLESIMAQTYINWVAYCVDDGSKDGTGKIIDQVANKDERIIALHKPNGGEHSARNYALDRIIPEKNTWIAFVDGDDYISPFMFEHLAMILEKEINSGVEYLRIRCQQTDNNINENQKYQFLLNRSKHEYVFSEEEQTYQVFDNSSYFRRGSVGGQISSAFINSELIERYKFRGPEEMKVMGDQVFTMKCAIKASRIIQYDFEDYFYRVNPDSILHTTRDTSKYIILCLNYVYEAMKEDGINEARRRFLENRYIPNKIEALISCRFKTKNVQNELPEINSDIAMPRYLRKCRCKYQLAYLYLRLRGLI